MTSWLYDLFWWLLEWALWLIKKTGLVLWDQAKRHPSAAILFGLAILRSFGTTVQTGTAGVLFSFGRAKKVLEPGFHPLIPIFQVVRHTPIRSITLDLPRQRVATGDGLVYDVDTTIVYRVEQPITAAVEVANVRSGVMTVVPLLVHELLLRQTSEDLESRRALDQVLTARAREALLRWGLYVETAGLSTIAPTRPTAKLTQLGARVAERSRLANEYGVPLTTAAPPPQGRARARYRRHRAAGKDWATSRVTVVLPSGGQLTVNDVELTASDVRTFDTPRLEREKAYYYTMKVDYLVLGMPVSESRTVEVRAGKVYTFDLTKPAPLPEATAT